MTDTQTKDTPGVIFPPPLIFLIPLIVTLAADYFLPHMAWGGQMWRWIAGGALILGGLGFMFAGVINFRRADTPVPPYQPVRALVTTGAHGISRNPMYAGMFLLYTGIGLAAASALMLALLIPIAFLMRYGVVAREEAYLERKFGEEYRAYKARVRRWV